MVTETGHISGMLTEGQDVKTSLIRQMDRLEGQVLVMMPPLVCAATSPPSGTSAERSSACCT
jgi:hypothetical protein